MQFSVYVWLLLIISRGGVTILARLRFFGGGKQSLGEAVRQIPLYMTDVNYLYSNILC